MGIAKFSPIIATILGLATAAATPFYHGRSNALFTRSEPVRRPSWNYANETTPDATANGMVGVNIEPDLVEGKPGKDGGVVKKLRLGPYTIPAGATINRPVPVFAAPCTNCYITAMQLGLEYADGKRANVDTGAWCHHIDLTVPGSDYTCPTSLTGLITGAVPAMFGQRIFSGGNERVPVRVNSKSKYGIDLGTARFGGVIELMSEAAKPITVYMTLTFEYVPKSTPGYKPAMMLWLDVTNCGHDSDFTASTGVYQKESQEWVMRHDADLLDAIGHVHDGGTKVDMFVNGELSCTSKQIYANRRGGYVEPDDGSIIKSMVMPEGSHISDVGKCKDWGTVKKGDKIKVIAYYNETEHMQMRNSKGGLEKQMGIMFTYMGLK